MCEFENLLKRGRTEVNTDSGSLRFPSMGANRSEPVHSSSGRDLNREVATLYEKYYPYIYQLVSSRVAPAEDREAVTQDIFLKAHKNWHRFNPEKGNELTFLITIARRHCIDVHRRSLPRREIRNARGGDTLTWQADRDSLPGLLIERSEQNQRLQDSIKKLSETQQRVIQGVLAGRTLRQITQDLGMPEGTVKSSLHRAYVKLREYLPELQDPGNWAA